LKIGESQKSFERTEKAGKVGKENNPKKRVGGHFRNTKMVYLLLVPNEHRRWAKRKEINKKRKILGPCRKGKRESKPRRGGLDVNNWNQGVSRKLPTTEPR